MPRPLSPATESWRPWPALQPLSVNLTRTAGRTHRPCSPRWRRCSDTNEPGRAGLIRFEPSECLTDLRLADLGLADGVLVRLDVLTDLRLLSLVRHQDSSLGDSCRESRFAPLDAPPRRNLPSLPSNWQ